MTRCDIVMNDLQQEIDFVWRYQSGYGSVHSVWVAKNSVSEWFNFGNTVDIPLWSKASLVDRIVQLVYGGEKPMNREDIRQQGADMSAALFECFGLPQTANGAYNLAMQFAILSGHTDLNNARAYIGGFLSNAGQKQIGYGGSFASEG